MDSNGREYRKFVDMVLDSTLQLTFLKIPFAKRFAVVSKIHNLQMQ